MDVIPNTLPESLSWVHRFQKHSENPVIRPWGTGYAADAVFNPAAVVHNDQVWLLCRCINLAQKAPDPCWSVSTLAWARSDDGIHFTMDDKPAFAPEPGSPYIGGFEDPRIVKIDDRYILTYTGVKGKNPDGTWDTPGMLAVSKDLIHWEEYGEVLPGRAIAILDRRIDGKYWAYWGNHDEYLAWTEDLRTWHVCREPALRRRPGGIDETLCEAAGAPLDTEEGILLIYNCARGTQASREYCRKRFNSYGERQFDMYLPGWALFDKNDPAKLLARCDAPILELTENYELLGISGSTIFAQGLVEFHGKKFLYYGCADMRIGVAVSE